MVKIYVRPGENIHSALKRFRKICEKEGITKEYKKHSYYESTSEKRRRCKIKAIRMQARHNDQNSNNSS